MGSIYAKPCRIRRIWYTRFLFRGAVGNFNYTGTIHDSDEILIGTNDITRQGEASKVLNVAKVRDGKMYEFHHLRAPK